METLTCKAVAPRMCSVDRRALSDRSVDRLKESEFSMQVILPQELGHRGAGSSVGH